MTMNISDKEKSILNEFDFIDGSYVVSDEICTEENEAILNEMEDKEWLWLSDSDYYVLTDKGVEVFKSIEGN